MMKILIMVATTVDIFENESFYLFTVFFSIKISFLKYSREENLDCNVKTKVFLFSELGRSINSVVVYAGVLVSVLFCKMSDNHADIYANIRD
jgi:hypothetical protein